MATTVTWCPRAFAKALGAQIEPYVDEYMERPEVKASWERMFKSWKNPNGCTAVVTECSGVGSDGC